MLTLRANEVVSRDEIVDAVWGDAPPASAVSNIYVYIGALRRVLEPPHVSGEPARVLAGRSSGYLLRLEPGQLDLAVFDEHLRAAARSSGAGELAAAVGALDAALELWRGTPLAGVTGPFADAQRRRLSELRLTALEDRAEAMLSLGQQANLVAQLSTLAAEHPLRERLRGLLMRALHSGGRRAEALQVYTDTRRLLVEELGLEPGAQLQRVHQAILADRAGDVVWPAEPRVPGPRRVPTSTLGLGRVPAQLPMDVHGFTGRGDELARLDSALAAAGERGSAVVISALAGTAGVGKPTPGL